MHDDKCTQGANITLPTIKEDKSKIQTDKEVPIEPLIIEIAR